MPVELPNVDEPKQICETCRWYEEEDSQVGYGRCRRYPPQMSIFDAVIRAMNARDAFLNRSQDGGITYPFDADYVNPYTLGSKESFDDGDDAIGPIDGDSSKWPEVWSNDFCGEWAAPITPPRPSAACGSPTEPRRHLPGSGR